MNTGDEDEKLIAREIPRDHEIPEKDAPKPSYPEYITLQTILGVGILIASSIMKRTLFSLLYFSIAYVYLSRSTKRAAGIVFTSLTAFILLAKLVTLCIQLFADTLQTLLTPNSSADILLQCLGISVFTKSALVKLMTVLPDATAFAGLLLLTCLSSKASSSNCRRRSWVVRLWCWLALLGLMWATVFSRNFLHFPVAGMLGADVAVCVLLLGLWTFAESMSKSLFLTAVGPLMKLVAGVVSALCVGDLPLWGFVPEYAKSTFGLNCSFASANDFLSLGGLLVCLLFAALYKENLHIFSTHRPSARSFSSVVVSNRNSTASTHKKTNSLKVTVCSKFMDMWKSLTLTPFLALQLSRVLVLVWIFKYSTYWLFPLLSWIYYGITFRDERNLEYWTRSVAVPTVALQFVLCRVLNIQNVGEMVENNLLERFGGFVFQNKSGAIIEFEYFFMLSTCFLLCLSVRMTRTMDDYETWKQGNTFQNPSDASVSTLGVVFNFLLSHFDKVLIMALYMIGFSKLNFIHALFLVWMVVTMVFPNFASEKFVYFIVLIIIRDFGHFIFGLISISGVTISNEVNLIMEMQGLDASIDKTSLFFKINIKWEIPAMIYVAYIQLVIYDHLKTSKEISKDELKHSKFRRCVKRVQNLANKILIWVVYIIILIFLGYEEITVILLVYYVLMVSIVATHIWHNNNDRSYKGFMRTLKFWNVVNIYNGFVLLAAYIFAFLLCTTKLFTSFYEKRRILFLTLGLDFRCSATSQLFMQKRFLLPFLVFYLGYFVKSYIKEEEEREGSKASVYDNKIEGISSGFLDAICAYSFHLLFFIALILALFWKLSAGMWLVMVIFAVHYCALHSKYLRARLKVPMNYVEFVKTNKKNSEEQKALAVLQRKTTLKLLIVVTSVLILLAVITRFTDHVEALIDVYLDGEKRINGLLVLKVVKAISIYVGVYYSEYHPSEPFIYEMLGYAILLSLCAVEIFFTDLLHVRIGIESTDTAQIQKIVYANPDEDPSAAKGERDTKTANLPKLEDVSYNEFEMQSSDDMNLLLYSKWSSNIIVKEDEDKINEKYRQVVKVILKYIMEHLIIFFICACAIVKNNMLEYSFLVLAIICLCVTTSSEMMLKLCYYAWIWFLINYCLSVITMSNDTVPQQVDDVILIEIFCLSNSDWPLYKVFLKNINKQKAWAEYLMLYNKKYPAMLTDFTIIFVQIVYFQHFCSLTPSLNTFKSSEKTSSLEARKNLKKAKSTTLKQLHTIFKAVFFLYSHMFCLFILLMLGVSNDGIISFGYVILCTLFMQHNLFSLMGKKEWMLPRYIRCVVRPYVVADLALQFLFQIPLSWSQRDMTIAKFIGIEKIEDSMGMIFLKSITTCLVLFQCCVFNSKQYVECCNLHHEKLKNDSDTRKNCMTYLYNNQRVMRFAGEACRENFHNETMEQITKSIRQWDQILLRKSQEQNEEQRTEQALEIMEVQMRIETLGRKLEMKKKFPESTWNNRGVLVIIYFWLYHRVNFVLITSLKKLLDAKKKLEKGMNYFPATLIELYQEQDENSLKIKLLEAKCSLGQYMLSIGRKDPEELESELETMKSQLENAKANQQKFCESLSKLTATKAMLCQIVYLFFCYVYTSIDTVCYILMIVAQCRYGNILSFVYVILLFGYALIVKCRPHMQFWKVLLRYSTCVVIIKLSCGIIYSSIAEIVCKDPNNCSHLAFFDYWQSDVSFAVSVERNKNWAVRLQKNGTVHVSTVRHAHNVRSAVPHAAFGEVGDIREHEGRRRID